MKIVIAPDSFKESLDALAVANCIETGFKEIFPDAEYVTLPLADGGEGTVDVLLQGLLGEKQFTQVTNPVGQPVTAMWAMLEASNINEKKTALIEVAAASGLDLLLSEQRNPLVTSTFGTGELILEALNQGAEKILIGLGGSATNDGGAGILQALGAKLLDCNGNEVEKGGLALSNLSSIDFSELDPRCQYTEMVVACDVNNPLCGTTGASHIFGRQKGASDSDVLALDSALVKFAYIAERTQHVNHQYSAGFAAAGGIPMGLSLAFNINLQAGIDMILDVLNADQILHHADLVITGEGQMDNQTLQGKTPYGIAKRAAKQGIPTLAIAGSLGSEVEALYGDIYSVFGTVRSPQTLEQVLQEAEKNLTRTARNIAATLLLGKNIIR